MARPTEESEANGADQAYQQSTLATSNQLEIIGDASDGDGGERPVREKLKKTSIASLAQYTNSKANPALHSDELPPTTESQAEQADVSRDAASASRGRPTRKRSLDDLQNEDTQGAGAGAGTGTQPGETVEQASHHKRMRSRDVADGEALISNGQAQLEPLKHHDEEENDVDARRSPGGPGVLVEPPAMKERTPPPTKTVPDDSAILSPKKKRSRDQFDKDHNPQEEGSEDSENSIVRSGSEPAENEDHLVQTTSRTATGEPEKKRPRDEELKSETNRTAQVANPSSGFANTATASPFAAFSTPKSPLAPESLTGQLLDHSSEKSSTSTSAFAASGLSAFSSSEKSPFSALGSNSASTSGGFGSLVAPLHSTGGFGSAGGFGGPSPFATTASSGFGGRGSSGFGGLGGASLGGTLGGSGFGGPRPLSGGLSGFAGASQSVTPFGGSAATKAFGAPTEEGDDDDDDDDGDDSDDESAAMDKPKDRRFQEQDRETGEEAEETVFSCRAKLYHFEGKEWKERGVGTFKINTAWAPSSDESSDRKSRLIMRTDGVHRVVLNTPIFKGMKVGNADGGEPTGKTLNVTGMEGGKPTLFALKIGKEDVVKDLYHKIMDLQGHL